MIWDLQTENAPAQRFRRAAEVELSKRCPDLAEQSDWLYETSEMLTELCGRWYPTYQVPANHYGILLAQLLWMMNRKAEAEAALQQWCSPEVALLCRPGVGMEACRGRLILHEAGVVRGASWAFMGTGRGWIIDLSRISPDRSILLELTISALLRKMISELASVWDASSGDGWLGLSGTDRFVTKRSWRGRGTDGQDLCGYSERILRHLASQRGWARVPDVKKLTI